MNPKLKDEEKHTIYNNLFLRNTYIELVILYFEMIKELPRFVSKTLNNLSKEK